MYCSQGVEDSTTAYFSPEAVTLAQLLLKLHGAVDCVAPDIGNLNLLVANSGGQRSNLQSPARHVNGYNADVSLDKTQTTPAECRAYAAECDRIAAIPAMEAHRNQFLVIASNWRKIADEIESNARRVSGDGLE